MARALRGSMRRGAPKDPMDAHLAAEREALEAAEQRKLDRNEAEHETVQAALREREAGQAAREPLLDRELGAGEDAAPGSWLERLRRGVGKTRDSFGQGLAEVVLGKKAIDGEVLERLEELLITSDMGLETANRLLERVEGRVRRKELADLDRLKEAVQAEIRQLMAREDTPLDLDSHSPAVVLFLGVNGTGKTTSIGKLAAQYSRQGKRVLLAAGDTFRAAAAEQLGEWAKRSGCDLVSRPEGSDPSSVIYSAVEKGRDEGYDLVICDTAGRLHTKINLMEELKKIKRVIGKVIPGAPHETWLVLDANTGQNAIVQAREFHRGIGVTGLIVTKLDGTARGGVVIGIVNEFQLPIRYIGVGEQIGDLEGFDAKEFADQLLN